MRRNRLGPLLASLLALTALLGDGAELDRAGRARRVSGPPR